MPSEAPRKRSEGRAFTVRATDGRQFPFDASDRTRDGFRACPEEVRDSTAADWEDANGVR